MDVKALFLNSHNFLKQKSLFMTACFSMAYEILINNLKAKEFRKRIKDYDIWRSIYKLSIHTGQMTSCLVQKHFQYTKLDKPFLGCRPF